MTHLKPLHRDEEISLYSIENSSAEPVEEYIFSTPETRRICNRPEMVGIDFPDGMRTATSRLMKHDPLMELVGRSDPMKNCVLHFLRGGLNFQVREALSDTYDFSRHYCSYMTSQRYQRGKRWKIKQDQYRKIDYLPDSTLLIGDCVATGSTMDNGLEVLLEVAREKEQPIKNMVVFTIGCGRAGEILSKFHERFQEEFDFERTLLFYVEGRFKLSDENMDLTYTLPGTDLLRHPALLAPEYERSLYNRLHPPLERCAIYDLGAKSFTYREHVHEVVEYWEKLRDSSLTLREAYRERWPEENYGSFEELKSARREVWPFVKDQEIRQLRRGYRSRWQDNPATENADTHEALASLAEERIEIMEELLRA